jgi:hypothetical protein
MLQQVGERTTISTQTLGENIASGTPYSGYAMASQNGRIPIIPIQEATEKVIHDACTYVLTCIREGIIITDQLKASEVLEDVDLTVKLEVDLPQDALRNAQVLNNLTQGGTPLSIEWRHNFLQIKDSKKMIFDTWSEQAAQTAFTQDLPNLVQQLMAMFQPKPPQPAPGQIPPGMEGMEQPQPGMEGLPPEAMGENAGYPSTPGGPEAAMAGGEVMPASEPMPPEQAMRGRA